jgi:peptidoglycan hydrolase-like protein with peptidoglycan-binding domain
MSMLTTEQVAWIKEVLDVDVSAARAGRSETAAANSSASPAVDGDTQAFTLPSIPNIPDIPDPTVKVHVTITNQSGHDLELVPGSAVLENPRGSEFDTPPPQSIGGDKGTATIVVSNNFPWTTGVGGHVTYKVADDPATTVFVQWERGRIPKRKATMTVTPDDPKRYTHDQGFDGDSFSFTFGSKDGPKPPTPANDTAASCLITVTNSTGVVLTLTQQGHERGDFMTFPAVALQPGDNTTFASVQTPKDTNKDAQGCQGFVLWSVGEPQTGTWRCTWDNPVGQKNQADASLEPQGAGAGLNSLAQAGQGDENVPFAFTLSGASEPPPPPPPPPSNEPFTPPPRSRQPTLRKGDKSADGWVEYAQELLGLPVTGVFDDAMFSAVKKYQGNHECKVDGIIGNETWSSLRQEAKEKPSTDGRKPHTYVEQGKEARWFIEDPHGSYSAASDSLGLWVESTGDEVKIDDHQAVVRVTIPGKTPKQQVIKVPIGAPQTPSPTGQGNIHVVTLSGFRKQFPSEDPNTPVEEYYLEAYLDAELGGDLWQGHPRSM